MKVKSLLSYNIYLLIILFCNYSNVFSQIVGSSNVPTQEQLWIAGIGKPPVPPDFDTKLNKTNTQNNSNNFNKAKNGKSLISGSVFLFDSLKYANILIDDSTRFNKIPIKFNLENRCIYYYYNNEERIVPSNLFKTISILKDNSDSIEMIFKSGFRNAEEIHSKYLFEVLSEGKITLLNNRYLILVGSKSEISNDFIGTYRNANDLFIYINKNLEKAKLKKSFFFDRFKEKTLPIMQQFVDKNQINFKKIEDLQMLVSFYNSLPE
ncbi:MAG: hypothetical protein ACOVMI_05885 [Chitinophagaceae bacterium]